MILCDISILVNYKGFMSMASLFGLPKRRIVISCIIIIDQSLNKKTIQLEKKGMETKDMHLF